MLWTYALFIAPLVAVTGVSLWLAHRLLAYRPRAGATPLAIFMVALAVWSVAYSLELGNAVPEIKIFWYKAKYLGVVAVLISAVYFVLQYAGYYRWANRRILFIVGLVPIVSLLALWTNSFHLLFLRAIRGGSQHSVQMLQIEYGPIFWLFTAYYYLVFAISMFLLVRRCWIESSGQLCRNVLALLVAAMIPWLANFFTLSPWNPIPDLDLTPFTFMITGMAIAWALFRHQLLYMMPVEHNAIVNGMKDGIIILNVRNQIVEMNPAAQRILRMEAVESGHINLLGQPVENVLAIWPTLITYLRGVAKEYNTVLTSDDEGGRRYFDVHIAPIYSRRNRLAGRLLVIHESTVRERTAEALRQRKLQLRSMVEQMRYIDSEKSHILISLHTELETPLHSLRQSLRQLAAENQSAGNKHVAKLNQDLELLDRLIHRMNEWATQSSQANAAACAVHPKGHVSSHSVQVEVDPKLSTAQLTSISGAHRFSPAS